MRIIDQLPDLPIGEGELREHSTGGEHADKFVGHEHAFNRLRQLSLESRLGQPIDEITGNQLYEMMQGSQQIVVFVRREGGQPLDNPLVPQYNLVAGAIASVSADGFERRVSIDELMVHPEMRQRKIASFTLGNVLTQGYSPATELVVDNTRYKITDWFGEKLFGAGFKHTDEHHSPAMWLPGSTHYPGDYMTDAKLAEVVSRMPEGWNGYLDLDLESGRRLDVFRGGVLVGRVFETGDRVYDEERDEILRSYVLLDAGDAGLDEIKRTTDQDVLRALLNNYGLLDQEI